MRNCEFEEMTVKFQPIAEAEVKEASAWYENKRDNLGLEFLDEISRCVSLAANNPGQFPILEGNIEQCSQV